MNHELCNPGLKYMTEVYRSMYNPWCGSRDRMGIPNLRQKLFLKGEALPLRASWADPWCFCFFCFGKCWAKPCVAKKPWFESHDFQKSETIETNPTKQSYLSFEITHYLKHFMQKHFVSKLVEFLAWPICGLRISRSPGRLSSTSWSTSLGRAWRAVSLLGCSSKTNIFMLNGQLNQNVFSFLNASWKSCFLTSQFLPQNLQQTHQFDFILIAGPGQLPRPRIATNGRRRTDPRGVEQTFGVGRSFDPHFDQDLVWLSHFMV